MSTTLQGQATEAARLAEEEDRQGLPGGVRLRSVKHLRDLTGVEYGVREALTIIDAVAEQARVVGDLSRFLAYSQPAPSPWWQYRFPNGYTASVIPDLHQPFRFEVARYSVDDVEEEVTSGLSTAEVEAKLAAIYNLPNVEAKE